MSSRILFLVLKRGALKLYEPAFSKYVPGIYIKQFLFKWNLAYAMNYPECIAGCVYFRFYNWTVRV